MQTLRLAHSTENNTAILEAAGLLRAGEVVAFPTETVYGLGADATNELAIAKIFTAKGRPNDNPLIVHIAGKGQMLQFVNNCPAYMDKLIAAFSPGPITYVLHSNGKIVSNVTAGLSTVGLRIPNHPTALALLEACGLPIAAPSANVSGRPSPTTAQHVLDDLGGRIAAVLDGGAANVGIESTVVDCTSETPVILRAGQITKEDIQQVIGMAVIDSAEHTSAPKSPGVKYNHYMPEVPLYLVLNREKALPFMQRERNTGKRIGILTTDGENNVGADKVFQLGKTSQEMAANLYAVLRQMKKSEIDIAFALVDSSEHIGVAVMDRLQRAALEVIL